MKDKQLPLIKEERLEKIIEALKCIDNNPFNRDKQKECILKLYPGKSEKSVFRGMIIPSTRHLGLIVGFGHSIRTTCNGRLLVLGNSPKSLAMKAVILEIDKRHFNFIKALYNFNGFIEKNKFYIYFSKITNYKSE